jgi:hypothetical protein
VRFLPAKLRVTVALGLMVGCSSNSISLPSSVPSDGGPKHATSIADERWPIFPTPLHGIPAPSTAKRGIYASVFLNSADDVFGFSVNSRNGKPPICTAGSFSYPNDIAVDGKGNLIVPASGANSVVIFKGPAMCGPQRGSISDPYGQPTDASSADAATGRIAVGNFHDGVNSAGSISICTLKAGCTRNLTNPNIFEVTGIAMANNGDCWASAFNSASAATLTYFKACSGAGVSASGFRNANYGGLDIDKNGNLVSISAFDSKLYVYKGCNPQCSLVGGPFTLLGESVFGHLNKSSTKFVAGDFRNFQLDVYSYTPANLVYQYSFKVGSGSDNVIGAAYNPRSRQ